MIALLADDNNRNAETGDTSSESQPCKSKVDTEIALATQKLHSLALEDIGCVKDGHTFSSTCTRDILSKSSAANSQIPSHLQDSFQPDTETIQKAAVQEPAYEKQAAEDLAKQRQMSGRLDSTPISLFDTLDSDDSCSDGGGDVLVFDKDSEGKGHSAISSVLGLTGLTHQGLFPDDADSNGSEQTFLRRNDVTRNVIDVSSSEDEPDEEVGLPLCLRLQQQAWQQNVYAADNLQIQHTAETVPSNDCDTCASFTSVVLSDIADTDDPASGSAPLPNCECSVTDTASDTSIPPLRIRETKHLKNLKRKESAGTKAEREVTNAMMGMVQKDLKIPVNNRGDTSNVIIGIEELFTASQKTEKKTRKHKPKRDMLKKMHAVFDDESTYLRNKSGAAAVLSLQNKKLDVGVTSHQSTPMQGAKSPSLTKCGLQSPLLQMHYEEDKACSPILVSDLLTSPVGNIDKPSFSLSSSEKGNFSIEFSLLNNMSNVSDSSVSLTQNNNRVVDIGLPSYLDDSCSGLEVEECDKDSLEVTREDRNAIILAGFIGHATDLDYTQSLNSTKPQPTTSLQARAADTEIFLNSAINLSAICEDSCGEDSAFGGAISVSGMASCHSIQTLSHCIDSNYCALDIHNDTPEDDSNKENSPERMLHACVDFENAVFRTPVSLSERLRMRLKQKVESKALLGLQSLSRSSQVSSQS